MKLKHNGMIRKLFCRFGFHEWSQLYYYGSHYQRCSDCKKLQIGDKFGWHDQGAPLMRKPPGGTWSI